MEGRKKGGRGCGSETKTRRGEARREGGSEGVLAILRFPFLSVKNELKKGD